MRIAQFVPFSRHTSFRTGGRARFWAEADSPAELETILKRARSENRPHLVLGEGTNVLAPDEDFPGYVVQPAIKGVEWKDCRGGTLVVAGAGEHWDDLVASSVSRNLAGLENLSSIPGSVGAAPVQNIGAYGVELKDCLEWVEVFNPKDNLIRTMSLSDCRFGYRDSFFKNLAGRDLIITRVALRLVPAGRPNLAYKDLAQFFSDKTPPTLAEVRKAVIEIRRKKLPDIKKCGTAGSFFKNPVVPDGRYEALAERFTGLPSFPAEPGFKKIPLAWILDKVCKLNGARDGDVGVYETQPLALVNYGRATSADVKNFAKKIAAVVKEKTDLTIEWEVNAL